MAPFAVLGRRAGTLVGVLLFGCLPKDDLSDYMNGGAAGASGGTDPGELPGTSGAGGAAGSGSEPDASLGGGGDGGSTPEAGAEPEDSGAPDSPDAATPNLDAGAQDGGTVLAAQCSASGGTLQPGTRDCFFIARAVLSWPAAVTACQARQSTLVTVKTSARAQFLGTLITAPVWIGARDAQMLNPALNNFTWIDDGTPVTTANWATLEPDNVADQFCVSMTEEAGNPWRDRPCSEQSLYACERSF